MHSEEMDKYQGRLEREYSNNTYMIISTVLRALTDKKITVTGNSFNRQVATCSTVS